MNAHLTKHAIVACSIAILAATLNATPAQAADSLASYVPADTLIYLEWTGHDVIERSPVPSAFGKLMANPEFKRMLEAAGVAVRSAIDEKVGADQHTAEMTKALIELGKLVWSKGAVVALVGIEPSMMGPLPQLAVIIPAGESADATLEQVAGLLKNVPGFVEPIDDPVEDVTFKRFNWILPVRLAVVDGLLLITLGEPTAQAVLDAKANRTPALATGPRFTAATKKIGTEGRTPVVLAHLDVVKLLETARPIVGAMTGQEGFPPPVEAMIEELGINAMHSITFAEQIADGGHRHSLYIASTGPKKGLLKLHDFPPITDEDLLAVPSDATYAKAVNANLSTIYDEVLRLVQVASAFDPTLPDTVNAAIADVEDYIGLKIKDDILDLLDDGWVIFDAPSSGGLLGSGFTLVIETKSADKVDQLIRKGLDGLSDMTGNEGKFVVSSFDHAGHKVHTVTAAGLPVPVAPSWAFHGNRLVLALYPQMVTQTIGRLASSSAASLSILERPDFARARRLLPDECVAIVYMDTKKAVGDFYSLALPLVAAGCSMAHGAGIPLDASMWPRREVFTRDLFGDGWAVSSDSSGVLLVGHGPWPVPVPPVAALAPTALMIAAKAGFVGRSQPSFEPPPDIDFDYEPEEPEALEAEPAPEAIAAEFDPTEKLTQIGTHCQLYALQHQEQFPPDLGALIGPDGLTAQDLEIPPTPGGSFTYVPGQTLKSNPENVLVYFHLQGQGGWVLTVAGEVKHLDEEEFRAAVDTTYKRVGSALSLESAEQLHALGYLK